MKLSEAILKAISEHTESTLDLNNRNITDADLVPICQALTGNKNVTCLILSHNQITSRGVELLVQLQHIERLCLTYNNIDDSGLLALANSRFKYIDINWNNITDAGVDILIKYSKQVHIGITSFFVSKEKKAMLNAKFMCRTEHTTFIVQPDGVVNTLVYYFQLWTSKLMWSPQARTQENSQESSQKNSQCVQERLIHKKT